MQDGAQLTNEFPDEKTRFARSTHPKLHTEKKKKKNLMQTLIYFYI